MRSWSLGLVLVAVLVLVEGAAQRSGELAGSASGSIKNPAEAPLQDNLATASSEQNIVNNLYKNPGQAVLPSTGPSAPSALSAPSAPANSIDECKSDMIGFELVTGYVFSAPTHILDDIPGTLMLTDCLEICQNNNTCYSVNYETGLCVLFSSNADEQPGALTKSQFPVFTIYAQKTCLGVKPCERAWCFDRVQGHRLKAPTKKTITVTSRQMCLDLCLGENNFVCRSANYNNKTGECDLTDMDRITLAGFEVFEAHEDTDYLENNCVIEPTTYCQFKKMSGRILKTVDSVYQDVETVDECRELCLNSPFRCHSYDHGDTGENVCRLSHHSRATLVDIQDPYLYVPEAATYELSSCYNKSADCRSGDMVVRVQTTKLFDGKIYAKGSPNSCMIDVKQSLDFELHLDYNNIECNVKKNELGRYLIDVIIQHHDTIVTSSDLGFALTCLYDLSNKTVTSEVDLGIHGDIQTALSEEVFVDSPNVAMKITDREGNDAVLSAEVGDPLALKFEILDENSPFEFFVRQLVAMDGVDSNEITLIDSDGCPTDDFIMGPILKSANTGKMLLSNFDAFKFPSSEIVQFRAVVTPCMPSCEPVQCGRSEDLGDLKSIISYGRKKRSVQTPPKNMLLEQTIKITKKFEFDKQTAGNRSTSLSGETVFVENDRVDGFRMNAAGLLLGGAAFLLAQVTIAAIWGLARRGRRAAAKAADLAMGMPPPPPSSSRADSMCKIYESSSGFSRSHHRHF